MFEFPSLVFAVVLAVLISGALSFSISEITFGSCGTNQYFDSTLFSCRSCGDGQMVDTSVTNVDGNYIGCKCESGYVLSTNDCTVDNSGSCVEDVCTICNSTVAYSDNSACTYCGPNTTLTSSLTNTLDGGSDCVCDSLYDALIETDYLGLTNTGNKTCLTCPSGTAVVITDTTISGQSYDGSFYKCQYCPDVNMEMAVSPATFSEGTTPTYTCTCNSAYVTAGVAKIGPFVCVATSTPGSTAAVLLANIDLFSILSYNTKTDSQVSVRSAVFKHYLVPAVTECTYYSSPSDIQSCQLLANLCVLAMYDQENTACSTFDELRSIDGRQNNSIYPDITTWGLHMPWISYPTGNNLALCEDTTMQMDVTLDNQHLEYVLVSYSLNGTYLGQQALDTSFAYCTRDAPRTAEGGGTGSSTKWQIFGTTHKAKYWCNLDTLLSVDGANTLESQRFYELFLVDSDNNNALYPVPVRLAYAGGPSVPLHADFLCNDADELVRRFFLTDITSGIADDGSSSLTPNVMRFASNIILEVGIRTNNPSKIYAPVLTVSYDTVEMSTVDSDTKAKYYVTAVYSMFSGDFLAEASDVEATCIAFTVILTLIRFYNWHYRSYRHIYMFTMLPNGCGINFNTMYHLALIGMRSYVQVFFPFTVCLCWYWFVFFKLQEVVSIMFSPMYNYNDKDSIYYPFVIHIYIMSFFQLGYVLHMIQTQLNQDVFFIDWEPGSQSASISGDDEEGASNGGVKGAKVSVWRTILVANEFSEMQTMRKTNIQFTLFFLAFFLVGMNLEYNATSQPDLDDTSIGEQNIILRFANATFFWLIISYAQWLWKFTIGERYLGEPAEQSFVDFCTIAKISVFIMDEKFHGWYLHCRSPHQFADGTMIELLDMLHKEEAGLVVDRSLDNAPDDVQSFEVFASGEFRLAFDKVYNNLLLSTSVLTASQPGPGQPGYQRVPGGGNSGRSGAGAGAGGAAGGKKYDKLFKYWQEVMIFLQEWVENNFNKNCLRHVIKEKSYFEALFDAAPDMSLPDQPTVFCPDRRFEYTSSFFLGNEKDLLLLNILAYSMFDIWFNNTILSCLMTYLLEQLLCYIRLERGKVGGSLLVLFCYWEGKLHLLILCLCCVCVFVGLPVKEDSSGQEILYLSGLSCSCSHLYIKVYSLPNPCQLLINVNNACVCVRHHLACYSDRSCFLFTLTPHNMKMKTNYCDIPRLADPKSGPEVCIYRYIFIMQQTVLIIVVT